MELYGPMIMNRSRIFRNPKVQINFGNWQGRASYSNTNNIGWKSGQPLAGQNLTDFSRVYQQAHSQITFAGHQAGYINTNLWGIELGPWRASFWGASNRSGSPQITWVNVSVQPAINATYDFRILMKGEE